MTSWRHAFPFAKDCSAAGEVAPCRGGLLLILPWVSDLCTHGSKARWNSHFIHAAAPRKVTFWTSLAFLIWLALHLQTICKLGLSCRPSFSLKPDRFSLFSQLPHQPAFGKVRVHEEEKDLPIISSLSAAQVAHTCLMHYDSETCLHIFLPASEFSVLICQLKEKLEDLNGDYGPMQNVFGQYFRVKAFSHQRARNLTSRFNFVLMKKNRSLIWWQEYWWLEGVCSPKLDFF